MMIDVDKLLTEQAAHDDPVQVAIAGCEFVGRSGHQIVNSVPRMTLAAVAVRSAGDEQREFRPE